MVRTGMLVLGVALLTACGRTLPPEILPTEPEDVRVLRGRVLLLDLYGGLRPLPGVRLAVFYSENRWDLVSDHEGRFTLDGIPFIDLYIEVCETPYALAVNYRGMGPARAGLPVGSTDRNVDLVVVPVSLIDRIREHHSAVPPRDPPPPGARHSIEGCVLDEEGAPLAGAFVLAEGTGRTASTNVAGGFRLTVLRQVGYDLRAQHGERAFPLALGVLGGSRDVEFRASRGATLGGTMRNESGRPLPGVTVGAIRDQGQESIDLWSAPSDRTDRQGRFLIGGLTDGQYALGIARAGGPYYLGETLRGVPAGSRDLVLTARATHFETGMRFMGKVIDALGRPVTGVVVTARPEGFRGPVLTDRSSGDGSFCIMGLAAGNHRIAADRPGSGAELRRVMTGACDLVLVVD